MAAFFARLVAALSLCLLTVDAVTEKSKQPTIIHRKLRQSALFQSAQLLPSHEIAQERQGVELLQQPQHRSSAENTELLQELAQQTPATAAELAISAKDALHSVTEAHIQTQSVLHNSNTETDMLETQLLANGESLHIIKKLAETVKKMKSEVLSLESHERICKKKLADIKNTETQRTEDAAAANTVQAAD